mgnify:CR=1 FL=1
MFGTKSYLEYLFWHEFRHSFSNPVVTKHKKEVSKYNKLFFPIAEQMHERGYGSWMGAVFEHIVRAVHCRLIALEKGEEKGKFAMLKEDMKGFKYINPLYQKLKKYKNEFPAKITKDKITIDNQTYSSADLQLAIVWSHPQNNDKVVVTFTSQQTEMFQLGGIRFEFSRNYFAIKDHQLLKKGNY